MARELHECAATEDANRRLPAASAAVVEAAWSPDGSS